MKRLLLAVIAFSAVGQVLANAPKPDISPAENKAYIKALQEATPEYAENRVMIHLDRSAVDTHRGSAPVTLSSLPDVQQLSEQYGVTSFERLITHDNTIDQVAIDYDLDLYYKVDFSSAIDVEAMAELYESLPSVVEAYPDYIVHASLTPSDSYYTSQWALKNTGQAQAYGGGSVGTPDCDIDADEAWDLNTGSSSVIIAIVDTGVDSNHPDLMSKLVSGYDFVNNDSNPEDDNMHGTACAGLAAAVSNNGAGVAGVSWGSSIMPVKVLDSNGSGYTSDIVDGINWARTHGADVISMSLGGGGYDSSFDSAISAANSAGVVVVSAAGNDDSSSISYPAAYTNSMAIGALSPCNERKNPGSCDGENWWGSNYGSGLDVMAPGTRLHTTYMGGGYISDMNGTSGATPHAAGVAALVKSANPSLTANEIMDIIRNSADDLGASGWDSQTGYGRLNAYQALLLAGAGTDPILSYSSHSISDANGQLDPGETSGMYVTIHNNGVDAYNVSATLSESSPWLSISSATQSYGTISSGGDDTNSSPYMLTASPSTPEGTTVTINMVITATGGYTFNDSFDLVIGTPAVIEECNTTSYSIPDNSSSWTNSTIYLSQDMDITDLLVYVDISHTYIGDLEIELLSPAATTVRLHDNTGGSADDISGWYDTELAVDGPGALSDFDGESTVGTWTLRVRDLANWDTGTLNEWCLHIEGNGEPPVNTAPVVSNIPNQTISEGESFATISLDNYVTDSESPDADIDWTYSGNTNLSVSIVNRVATITYPGGWNGSETITFTATDPGGLSDSDPATFEVTGVNDPPVVSDIPNQLLNEGDSFSPIYLDNYVTDDETPVADLIWTYSGNTELSVSIVNRVATVTAPNPDWSGYEAITFTATDEGGLSDGDAALFRLTEVNDAPVVSDIPNQSINQGESFVAINLDDYVTDVETPDVGISWTYSGNVDLSVSIASRVATITYPGSWSGSETITFTATDPGGLNDSDAATFEVDAVNDPPVVTDIPNQLLNEGDTFAPVNLDDYVSDDATPDAQIVWSYSGNTDLTVSIVDRVATISAPDPDWNGYEAITFTATDQGGLTDSDAALFRLTAVNDAPVVSDIPDQHLAEGATFATINLDDYVTDVETPDAGISWTYSGNTELYVSIVNRVATIMTPDPDWNGIEPIMFTATDPGGLYDNDTAEFIMDAVNDPPQVADIPDQIIPAGQTFDSFDLDDFVSDVDNGPAEMDWTVSGNVDINVQILGNHQVNISYPAGWSGSETITFTCSDGEDSDQDTATFTVVSAVDDLVITFTDPNTILEWSPVQGAVEYNLYRMTEPYAQGSAVLVTTTADTTISLPNEHLTYASAFYFVVAVF